jgi:photosystem II stability/assembly factor-like uncharacterized protein
MRFPANGLWTRPSGSPHASLSAAARSRCEGRFIGLSWIVVHPHDPCAVLQTPPLFNCGVNMVVHSVECFWLIQAATATPSDSASWHALPASFGTGDSFVRPIIISLSFSPRTGGEHTRMFIPMRLPVTILAGFSLVLILSLCAMASDSWVKTNGPYGGSINAIVVHGDTVVVSDIVPYRSTNRGATWSQLLDYSVNFYACDSSGYLWGFDRIARRYCYKRLSGLSLPVIVNTPSIGQRFNGGIFIGPTGKRYIWESQPEGDVLWVNSGTDLVTWRKTLREGFFSNRSSSYLVSPHSGTLFSVCNETPYRSTDDGDHWQALSFGLPDTMVTGFASFDVVRSGTMFATVTDVVAGMNFTLRSTDEGATWARLTNLGLGSGTEKEMEGRERRLYGIEMPPGDVLNFTAVSTDDGVSWSGLGNDGLQGINPSDLYLVQDSTMLVVGNGGGPFRSTDLGEHWNVSATGIPWAAVRDVAVDSSGVVFASTLESGVYASTDRGTSWKHCSSGIPAGPGYQTAYALAVSTRGSVFAAGIGLYRSNDHGVTWSSATTGLPTTKVGKILAFASGALVVTFSSQYGTYRSTDDGDTWIPSTQSIPLNIPASMYATGGATMAVGITDAGPFVTTDNGDHWVLRTAGLDIPLFECVAISPAGRIFACRDTVLMLSSDAGLTWHHATSRPLMMVDSSYGVANLWYVPGIGLMAGFNHRDSVLYYSPDDAGSWSSYPLNGLTVQYLGINRPAYYGSSLYLGTESAVWRRDITVGVDEPASAPESSSLTVAPQPLHDRGTVRISLEHEGSIDLTMVDCLGRVVSTVAHGTYARGDHEFEIDMRECPAGVYRLRCSSHAHSVSRSIPVVR